LRGLAVKLGDKLPAAVENAFYDALAQYPGLYRDRAIMRALEAFDALLDLMLADPVLKQRLDGPMADAVNELYRRIAGLLTDYAFLSREGQGA
jgi:hypothetical protein